MRRDLNTQTNKSLAAAETQTLLDYIIPSYTSDFQ